MQREEAEAAAQAQTEKKEAERREAVQKATALRTTDFADVAVGRSNHSDVSRCIICWYSDCHGDEDC